MTALERAWRRFWFEPESAINLAAARVVFSIHALWILLSRDLAGLAALPAPFWSDLAAGTRWRYLLFPGHPAIESGLQWVAAAALVSAALGLFPRSSCLVSGLLLYHLAPFETAFWTPAPLERGLTISVLALVGLACSRCGDALSFHGVATRPSSWEYAWPLRLVQLFVCQIYFGAGVAKLMRVGLEWASAENLRGWLLVFNQQDQIAVFSTLGRWIADRPVLCALVAVGALGLNLVFPLALFSRRARPWLVATAMAFHTGVLFAMNIAFLNLPQLLIFADWSALGRRLSWERGSSPAPPSAT